jgi:hypothetical protein
MDTQHTFARTPHSLHNVDSRRTTLAVAVIVIAGLILLLGGVAFSYLNRAVPMREGLTPWPGSLLYNLIPLSALTVGGLIALRRPEHPFGWLWLLNALATGLQGVLQGYATYALLAVPGALPLGAAVLALVPAAWVTNIAVWPFLLLLFPSGRLPSPRWRSVAWAVVVASVTVAVIGWAPPGPSGFIPAENPLGVDGLFGVVADVARNVCVPVIFAALIAAAVSLALRFRRAEGVEREQLKWFAFGGALLGAYICSMFFISDPVNLVFGTLAPTALPITTAIAILRHRLFDIDVIIRRTVIYGVLTAIVGAVYALLVGAAGVLLPSQGALLPLLVTLAVAVPLARPLHRLLQRLSLPKGQAAREGEALAPNAGNLENNKVAATRPTKILAPGARDALATADLPRFEPDDGKAASRRVTSWLASGLWVVAMMLLGLGLLLERLNAQVTVGGWPLYGLTFAPFVTMGALVAARRPGNAVGWIFLWSGLLNVVWSTAHHYATYTIFVQPGSLPALPIALFLARSLTSDLGITLALLFAPLLFPDGRLPSARWRPFMFALLGTLGLSLLSTLLMPGPILAAPPLDTLANPLDVPELASVLSALHSATTLLMLLFTLGVVGSLVVRYRSADAVRRQQIKWFTFPVSLILLFMFISTVGRMLNSTWIEALTLPIAVTLFAATPLAVGIAILRHNLFDIDLIIRRTVIYGALTVCLGGLYALAVGAAGMLLPSQGALLPALITLAVAVPLARPLHRLLQRLPLPQAQSPLMEEAPPMIANTNAQVLCRDDASARRAALLMRVVPWLGTLSGVASVAMAVGAVVFSALNEPKPLVEVLAMNALGGGLFALAFAVVGVLVTVRRPSHPLGWIYCLIALSQLIGVFAFQYATYTLVTRPDALPGGGLASWLGQVAWFPGLTLALTFALLLFPNGRLPSPRWRLLGWVSIALLILWGVVVLTTWPYRGKLFMEHPEQIPTYIVGPVLFPAALLCGMASAVSLFVRFRRAAPAERQQIKWLAVGATAMLAALIVGNTAPDFSPGTPLGLLLTPLVASIPISAGIAILRHRLFDIDVIIRRTVIYGALTACLGGLYALVVGAAGVLLPGQNVLLPALITLAMAAPLVRPLHRLLERLPLPQAQSPYVEEAPPMIADTNAQVLCRDDASARRAALLSRVVPWLGVLSAVASVGMAVGAVVFSALNGRTLVEALATNSLGGGLFALSDAAIGALVAVRRPRHPLGWIYCAIALTQWLGIFAIEYATYALVTSPGSLPGGGLMSWLGQVVWFPGAGLLLTFALLLFPTGRLPSPRWRLLAWAGVMLQALWAIVALAAWPHRGRLFLEHPDRIPGSWITDVLGPLIPPALLLCGLASVISLAVRFRSAGAVERQQIKWLGYGAATFLVAFIVGNVVPQFYAGTALGLLLVPFSACIPLATGIAIVRYRLFDIDLIIRRTVIYGAIVAALALVYFASVALIQGLSQALTGPQSDLAIVALTLLIAALFNPLRLRVQGFIDRRFYREKVDFRQAFTAFAREVRTVIELPALLGLLAERTTALLHIAHGAVFLRDGGGFALAEGRALPPEANTLPADADDLARLAGGEPISRPRDAAFPLLLPLLAPRPTGDHAVATDLVGVLALGPRLSDQRYSRDDESLLLGLADQAGTAIYVAQLIAEQRAEAQRREEQERQLAARRASPIGRAEAAAEELLADRPAAFVTLHRLANEAGQSAEAARLLEHLPRAIGLLDHPAAPALAGLADGLGYLVASRAQPELLPAGLRALLTHLQPAEDEPIEGAAAALALYDLCARALDASSVAAIAELLPELPEPGRAQVGPLAGLAQALGELHEAAGALRAYERVDTPQDRLAYLAAAVERLSRVDRSAAELGAADQPLVQRIAERWLAVAAGAMGELQTRARLVCRLLTRHTWQDDLVALTLTIRNDGRGAALNLQVSLTAGGEYTPLDAPVGVERLAMGEEVSLTLRVRPRVEPGASYFRARFLIRYDDPRGPDQVEQFADEVQLLADEGAFQFIPNPYVVGTPLQNGSPLFFGRQDVLGFIEENLQAAHRNNLVLIGQRRTGKTSLLKQLPDRLGDSYLPVYLDGQSLGLDPGMPGFFLSLATEIGFALDDRGISVVPPEPEDFATSPAAAFERGFLPQVRAAIGGRHLLLLLDEFEELEAAVRRGSLDASLFGFLRHLIQHSADLSVIFCGTHRLEELAADYWSVLFNISLYRHVGFLSRDEAERLIQEPVAPYGMRYDGLALEKIWRVTSGHPYFLQLLCHSLVNRHNKSGHSYLTVAGLNDALDEILAAGEAHFVYLWAESSEHERLVLAALSRAVPLTGRATPAQVADELVDRGVQLERGAVAAALHRLALRDILAAADSAEVGGGDAYGWKLGLLGLWVEKYRSLSRVIDEVRG